MLEFFLFFASFLWQWFFFVARCFVFVCFCNVFFFLRFFFFCKVFCVFSKCFFSLDSVIYFCKWLCVFFAKGFCVSSCFWLSVISFNTWFLCCGFGLEFFVFARGCFFFVVFLRLCFS